MTGKLILVPTPIDDESDLIPQTKELLLKAYQDSRSKIYVEEAKTCRRRWLNWGLPREAIDHFVLYNEHSRQELLGSSIIQLHQGQSIYLLSDCGLPAFCDPGKELVSACHDSNIKVTSASFHNSVLLALALSGFDHEKFLFQGFLPKKLDERKAFIKSCGKVHTTQIFMDTPYRLKAVLQEFAAAYDSGNFFLGCHLNRKDEWCMRGSMRQIQQQCPFEKADFILIAAL